MHHLVRIIRRRRSTSPIRISLPRSHCRVGLHIVLFGACSAFTHVAAYTLARSPIRGRYPKASDTSSPPCLLRLLPAGAGAGRGLHPLEKRRLFTAHVECRRSSSGRLTSKSRRSGVFTSRDSQPLSNLRISLLSDDISNGFVVTSFPVSGWSFPIAAFSAKRTVSPPPQSTPVSASLGASWSTPLKLGRQRHTVYPCRARNWMRICPPD